MTVHLYWSVLKFNATHPHLNTFNHSDEIGQLLYNTSNFVSRTIHTVVYFILESNQLYFIWKPTAMLSTMICKRWTYMHSSGTFRYLYVYFKLYVCYSGTSLEPFGPSIDVQRDVVPLCCTYTRTYSHNVNVSILFSSFDNNVIIVTCMIINDIVR